MSFNIAVDGPAGAGKSTIAKRVAAALSFHYVDTGAMYRAIALYLIRSGIPPEDTEAIGNACRDIPISIGYSGQEQQVFLNGENVTGELRAEKVGNMASIVSANPMVREALLSLQRRLAREQDVIMDGRDIVTKILPKARLKIFLTASTEKRADRRYRELLEKGEPADFEKIRRDIEERDNRDRNRKTAPLRQAPDAVLVDTTDMDIDQVTERILELYRERAVR